MPKQVAEVTWFTLTVAMAFAFVRLSLIALPDRRLSAQVLVWLTVLLNGKFFVKELAFGQFNLPVGLLLIGAVIAAQRGRGLAAGAAVAAGVFVKPYALVSVPWLARTFGWRPFVPFTLVMVAGLLLPALSYGWNGNLTLLYEWYRTVTDTTAPNLLSADNISFASMWAKWLGPEPPGQRPRARVGRDRCRGGRRRHVLAATRDRAELSRSGVLLGADSAAVAARMGLRAPARAAGYMCIVDRWRDSSRAWRAVAMTAFIFSSFLIFDVLRRTLYIWLVENGAGSVGAILIAACLIRLRWKALA